MVSIIIPSYNRKKKLIRSIHSVLSQTYSDIEVIIIDDGSTDGSQEAVKAINDSRIIYIQQKHLGACAARNNGVKNAHGQYVAFHDSDDVCRQDRIQNQMQIITDTNADIVCGNVCIHKKKHTSIFPNYPEGWINSRDRLSNIGTISFLGKKQVFQENRFDDSMPRWQDLDILLRIFGRYKIYFTEKILVDYYLQSDSISSNPQKGVDAFEIIMYKYPDIQKENKLLYGTLLKMYAMSKIELGRKDYIDDFKKIYQLIPNKKNLLWKIFAYLRLAEPVHRFLNR